MNTLNRDELKVYLKARNKSLISNYKFIEIVNDTKHKNYYFLREVYGFENSISSETWRHYHFPNSSPNKIVVSSYHEGRNTIFLTKEGTGKINLVPAFRPIAIESIKRMGNKVKVTYAGYAGGGLSASIGRGLAAGVDSIEMLQEGGGKKIGKGAILLPLRKFLIIGTDDTDNGREGATFDLVREATCKVVEKYNDVQVLNISECNLYPVKERTSNCFATSVGLSYIEGKDKKKSIIDEYKKVIQKKAVSDEATLVVFDGFIIPKELEIYGVNTKISIIESINRPLALINQLGLEVISFSSKSGIQRGVIGALASIGLFWKFKYTAAPPLQCFPLDAQFYPNFYESNRLIEN